MCLVVTTGSWVAPEPSVASDHVAALFDGGFSVLVVEGEAGIGKTRLVEVLVSDARRRGASIRRSAAHSFDRARPFEVIADALGISGRSTDPRLAAAGRLILGRSAPAEESAPVDVRHLVVEEILDIVETVCGSAPIVLVLEDMHWACESG